MLLLTSSVDNILPNVSDVDNEGEKSSSSNSPAANHQSDNTVKVPAGSNVVM